MEKLNNVKKIPHFTYTIGMLPTSFKDSLTYQEQLTWLCNYLSATIEPSLNNTIDAFNELLDEFNTLDTNVTDTLNQYNETLTTALEDLNTALSQGLTDIQNYFSEELVTIATNYLNEHVNNGDIYLSLGMDYDSTEESLEFKIDSVLSDDLVERLSTLSTPQRGV